MQHRFLLMLEKCKNTVDKKKVFRALLTDLSRAFDCISHELLVVKLHAYDFSLSALKIVNDYLLNRKIITKFGPSCST